MQNSIVLQTNLLLNVLIFLFKEAQITLAADKTHQPIYWNVTNYMFRGDRRPLHVNLEDKIDLICPTNATKNHRKDRLFFKIHLVDERGFRLCRSAGGRRLITCNMPQHEKKYTFYFQEISPSPWALEFEAEKSYYVISTSDGSEEGLNQNAGGSCVRFNMKLEIRVHEKSTNVTNYRKFPDYEKPLSKKQPTSKETNFYKFFNKDENDVDRNDNRRQQNDDDYETDENDDIMLGIIVGAGVVIALVSSAFLLHRRIAHKRKRVEVVKYDFPSRPPQVRDATAQGENTYDEIRPSYRSNTMTRMTSYSDYPTQPCDPRGRYFTMVASPDRRQGCYGDARSSLGNRVSCTPPVVRGGRRAGHSPPSYSECFLDNGGSVVAV